MVPDAVVRSSPPVPQAQPPADMSSRTVTMLVVLTLIISFLGAWMNLHQASLLGASPPDDGAASSSARVSFTIDPPEADSSSAIVGFVIAPPSNGP